MIASADDTNSVAVALSQVKSSTRMRCPSARAANGRRRSLYALGVATSGTAVESAR